MNTNSEVREDSLFPHLSIGIMGSAGGEIDENVWSAPKRIPPFMLEIKPSWIQELEAGIPGSCEVGCDYTPAANVLSRPALLSRW